MRSRRVAAPLAVTVSAALVLSACGGGGSSGGGGEPAAGAPATDASISVYGGEPENPLVPGNTTESEGSKVIDALFDGLVEYTPDGQVENLVAQTIETTDSQVYTITLADGWTFHDGTPVDAASFVDAWNYTALATNAQSGASFFSTIQGFADVNPGDGGGAPTAETMSGLRVIDDSSFEVTLTGPSPIWSTTIGYEVFSPLPDSFFADPAAFEAAPVGNGPFRYVERTPSTNIVVERYEEYAGPVKPQVQRVEFRQYADGNAAYQDVVAGNLDFYESIPGAFLVDQIFQQDLPERNGTQEYLGITAIAYPFYVPAYQSRELRQALSMAVNRQEIADTVFGGLVTPADGFVGAGTPGRAEDQCGELCTYSPDRARELYAQSGFAGPVELVTNVESPINQQLLQAVCQSITNTLQVACNVVPVPTFAEFLQQRDDGTVTGPFRAGWIADYPSIESFLNPLYRTGASSNDGDYSSPQFDEIAGRADVAPSLEEANALYQEAERVLVQDMPAIPLFNPSAQFGWSERLDNVELGFSRSLELTTVTVNE